MLTGRQVDTHWGHMRLPPTRIGYMLVRAAAGVSRDLQRRLELQGRHRSARCPGHGHAAVENDVQGGSRAVVVRRGR